MDRVMDFLKGPITTTHIIIVIVIVVIIVYLYYARHKKAAGGANSASGTPAPNADQLLADSANSGAIVDGPAETASVSETTTTQ